MQIEELYNEGDPRMKLTQQLNHTVIMLADIVATQEKEITFYHLVFIPIQAVNNHWTGQLDWTAGID